MGRRILYFCLILLIATGIRAQETKPDMGYLAGIENRIGYGMYGEFELVLKKIQPKEIGFQAKLGYVDGNFTGASIYLVPGNLNGYGANIGKVQALTTKFGYILPRKFSKNGHTFLASVNACFAFCKYDLLVTYPDRAHLYPDFRKHYSQFKIFPGLELELNYTYKVWKRIFISAAFMSGYKSSSKVLQDIVPGNNYTRTTPGQGFSLTKDYGPAGNLYFNCAFGLGAVLYK